MVYNGGPDYDVMVKESAQPVRRLKLDRRTEKFEQGGGRRGEQFATRVEGDSLRIVSPQIQGVRSSTPRKAARRIEQSTVNRGWQGAGDHAEVDRLRAKIRSEAKPPADMPPKPKFERVAEKPVRAEGGSPGTAKAVKRATKSARSPEETAGDDPTKPTVPDTGATADQPVKGGNKAMRKAAERNGPRGPGEPDSSIVTPSEDPTKKSNARRRENAKPGTAKENGSKRGAQSEVNASNAAEKSPSPTDAPTPSLPGEAQPVVPEAVPAAPLDRPSITRDDAGDLNRRRRGAAPKEAPITPTGRRGVRPSPAPGVDSPQPGRDTLDAPGASAPRTQRPDTGADRPRRNRGETPPENGRRSQGEAQSPRGDGSGANRPPLQVPEAKPAGATPTRPKAGDQRRKRLDGEGELDGR